MNTCPGSALYIYEKAGVGLVCCCGDDKREDFCAGAGLDPSGEPTEEVVLAMYRHIIEHDLKGDHVRKSLLAEAKRRVAK